MQPEQQQTTPQSTPQQPRQKWWKTRQGLTKCAYIMFVFGALSIIFGLLSNTFGFISGTVWLGVGVYWLIQAKKLPA